MEGAPKRPATAFFRWAASQREAIKTELGADSKPTAVMRRAGELWKTVDDKTRAKFQGEYEAEKAQYDATMAKLKADAAKKPKAPAAAAPAPAAAAASSPASPARGVKRSHSSSVASDADSVTDLDTSAAPDSAKKHKKKSKKSKSSKKHKKSKKSHGDGSE